MSNPIISIDIFIAIARADPTLQTWNALLAIPLFGKYTLTDAGRKLSRELFTTVEMWNNITYKFVGRVHRDNDLPAVIMVDGTEEWWQHGKRHRDGDKPAVIWHTVTSSRSSVWHRHGADQHIHDKPTNISTDETQKWYQHDKLHRDGDKPAVIFSDGTQEWWQHGKLHRDNNLPAVINTNGWQMWCQHDKLHRDDDKPAVVYANGTQEWWKHDELHRDDDNPAVIWSDGSQEWCRHDKRHRDNDMPAVIRSNGTQEWYQHGKIHRNGDKPAVVYACGTQEWWEHDVLIYVRLSGLHLTDVPSPILVIILLHLPPSDFASIASTCRSLAAIASAVRPQYYLSRNNDILEVEFIWQKFTHECTFGCKSFETLMVVARERNNSIRIEFHKCNSTDIDCQCAMLYDETTIPSRLIARGPEPGGWAKMIFTNQNNYLVSEFIGGGLLRIFNLRAPRWNKQKISFGMNGYFK